MQPADSEPHGGREDISSRFHRINALDLSHLVNKANKISLALEGIRVHFLKMSDEDVKENNLQKLIKRAVW